MKFISRVVKSAQINKYQIQQIQQGADMSLKNREKATAKNVAGKVQEAVGNVTGDPKDQAEGKEKQAEAKVMHTVEDVKDEVKAKLD
ncbi:MULTISPECIES: CsbD family protein [Planktothrix]|jgi:uncharacterized protein YjbJ (UPF0337 family)|uniref:CsbD-like domain-containing protein n=1 Tax=Planktothrix rubescens CCAP 1459/22 TaxID=329571 RepID=A0A6J7ZGE1_PLARU|nr:conserved hypothetical protein [Planktothrix rubescens NIVA-CYA 18]CAD5947293.1 UPF0337 protein [Planktothrix rubescens NIVA-CYA 18]